MAPPWGTVGANLHASPCMAKLGAPKSPAIPLPPQYLCVCLPPQPTMPHAGCPKRGPAQPRGRERRCGRPVLPWGLRWAAPPLGVYTCNTQPPPTFGFDHAAYWLGAPPAHQLWGPTRPAPPTACGRPTPAPGRMLGHRGVPSAHSLAKITWCRVCGGGLAPPRGSSMLCKIVWLG